MALRKHLRGAVLVLCALTFATGCGDDSPGAPEETAIVNFPGDAMTLHAALDMAVPGDTVLVAPGEYMIDSSLVFDAGHTGVTLMGRPESEAVVGGAARPVLRFTMAQRGQGIVVPSGVLGITVRGLRLAGSLNDGVRLLAAGSRLVDCAIDSVSRFGVYCSGQDANSIVERNVIVEPGIFGVDVANGAAPLITRNTIVGANDCGIRTVFTEPRIERNVIVESTNFGIACFIVSPVLSCNAFFANGTDYSTECAPGASDFHADPLFCERATFSISSGSPCAAANAGDCGQIGAGGVGCAVDTVAVAQTSPRVR
ncbi:MAG: right-handed parallel beta-helix repeat-containing protein [bacterium]